MTLPNYCTSADIEQVMTDVTWSTEYTPLLARLCVRASRAIDSLCGREPGFFIAPATATERRYSGSGRLDMMPDPFAALTSVAVDEYGLGTFTAWAASEYIVQPYNAAALNVPYTSIVLDKMRSTKACWYPYQENVKITARFGWALACPEDITQATIVWALQNFKKGQSGYVGSGAANYASIIMNSSEIDPELNRLLQPYKAGPM